MAPEAPEIPTIMGRVIGFPVADEVIWGDYSRACLFETGFKNGYMFFMEYLTQKPRLICQKMAFSVFTVLLLASCGGNQPYILDTNEFNRESPTYGKEITDRNSVTVCYDSGGTTPAIVNQMARQECQRFAKQAEFSHQSYQQCPLLTPVAAVYNCK